MRRVRLPHLMRCGVVAACAASSSGAPQPDAPKPNAQAEATRQAESAAPSAGSDAPLATSRHHYEPGPIARSVRRVVVATTEAFSMRRRVAQRLERGLTEVARMEREAQWLRTHGSPLHVLGLPDSAELDDVKVRYKELLFEVHPDTAPKSAALALMDKGGITLEQARARQMEQFELLQTAYKMAIAPNSLWHQDGNAPALLSELRGPMSIVARLADPQVTFPIMSYALAFALMAFLGIYVANAVLEGGLKLFDREFFDFMIAQEAEEKRKRDAGEEVDTNPVRLAPEKLTRMALPGTYVHRHVGTDDDD